MKNRSKLIFLLAVITIGAFALAKTPSSYIASATYVEGSIRQDTIWTLTDSPFVVSKDITVHPNVTLTIEPGVEVKFGGDFSLLVEGSLSASGAENNTIIFTSNKDQPGAGDWNTIKFNGTEPSTLAYCVVQHAKNAITVENSGVNIENCEIGTNSLNGITIVNSSAEVKGSEIANNFGSGVCITGDNQVTIQNNTISSNANGVLLTGNLTTGVTILENIVMSNTQSGIQLDADDYSDLVIINNIISANKNGFSVSGQASTYITKNSISYNNIGIFYKGGKDHVAYYNDIYGNEYGMDIASNATVNAEYNYWGHESGPYHVSLNPSGKGDPVGGNGVNLDFIFFLTAPISYINTRPTARLLTDKTLVPPNQVVTFIATTSSDDGRVDKYFFDFGDGNNSGWTTLSIFIHNYSSVGTYQASVTVMDDFGVTSTNVATATINVQDLNPLNVIITPNLYTVGGEEQVSITVGVTYETSAIENAGVTLFAVKSGNFTPSSGLTDSTGHFTTTFTAPNVTQITNVRITATASKSGYADGSDYMYLRVLPRLSVEVTADPLLIKSEAMSDVTAHVTCGGQLVADALVIISSDGGGNFSATAETTDSNGDCTFVFTAPQTSTQLNITITAIATKSGYADGQGQTKMVIEPKVLVVELKADPITVSSEETSYVTAHVTYNATPISDVNVTMSSVYGSFSPETGITDSDGNATFTFTAPQAVTQLNVTVVATATKAGYADGEGQVKITVNPGILDVQVTATPTTVESRATSTVTVHVTCNANPVVNATVTVFSDGGGNFSATAETTDSNGDCTFVFTAPQTSTQLNITITATATKTGYIDEEGQTGITVNPEVVPEPSGGIGLPLTTIIIIAVLIIMVAIVMLLIKLKIIYISWK